MKIACNCLPPSRPFRFFFELLDELFELLLSLLFQRINILYVTFYVEKCSLSLPISIAMVFPFQLFSFWLEKFNFNEYTLRKIQQHSVDYTKQAHEFLHHWKPLMPANVHNFPWKTIQFFRFTFANLKNLPLLQMAHTLIHYTNTSTSTSTNTHVYLCTLLRFCFIFYVLHIHNSLVSCYSPVFPMSTRARVPSYTHIHIVQ